MQIVLLSRLLLNLRKASLKTVHVGASLAGFTTSNFLDDLTHVSSIAFTPEQDIAMATSPTYRGSEETNTRDGLEDDDIGRTRTSSEGSRRGYTDEEVNEEYR